MYKKFRGKEQNKVLVIRAAFYEVRRKFDKSQVPWRLDILSRQSSIQRLGWKNVVYDREAVMISPSTLRLSMS